MKRSLLLTLGGLALAACMISRATRRTCSFSGKVVLITGGSCGLGLVLARQLCAEGARVALLARNPVLENALFPNISGSMMKVINSTLLPPPSGPDGDTARSGLELDRHE
jgi:hypothetical protein